MEIKNLIQESIKDLNEETEFGVKSTIKKIIKNIVHEQREIVRHQGNIKEYKEELKKLEIVSIPENIIE